MPYIVVFENPPIQLHLKDSLFDIGEEIAPERRPIEVESILTNKRFLAGENVEGGLVVLAVEKINFIQYVSDEELDQIKARRQEEAERRPGSGSNISIPRMVIPRKTN
jgi:hypothetical protein